MKKKDLYFACSLISYKEFLNVSKNYISSIDRINYITMDYIIVYKAFTPYHVVLINHWKGKGTAYILSLWRKKNIFWEVELSAEGRIANKWCSQDQAISEWNSLVFTKICDHNMGQSIS